MPAAYFIANVEVTDPKEWETYRTEVTATVAAYDGDFLARGGSLVSLDGEQPLPLLVLVRFPSMQRAKEWFHSEEYRPLSALRQSASKGTLFVVEGLS